MTDEYHAEHDDYRPPSQTRVSKTYSAPVEYDENPEKSAYGSVTGRFDDHLALTHPAPDIETLRETTHVAAQLHAHNREQQDEWSHANDGTTLYDLAILDVLEVILDVPDLSPSGLEMRARRFRIAVLKKARKPATHKAFVEYLRNADRVLAEIGYQNVKALPGYETLRVATEDTLSAELSDREQDAVDHAVVRAIYNVYRNGIDVPDSVRTAFGFDSVAPPLSERGVPRADRKAALRNWVRYLMEHTLDPLTFYRSNPQTTFRQYIGLFAASALYNCGLQQVANISDYQYPRDLIPGGSGVGKYIRDDDLPLNKGQAALSDTDHRPITAQFDAVHRSTLDIADQMGFFDGSQSVAVDLYRIDWDGEANHSTINRPARKDNDVRSQWTYAVFGVIDTDSRFTLGTRWLPNKSEYPDVVKSLAPIADEYLDVQALYADGEIVSGSLLDAFRGIADEDYVVRAPDHPIVKQLKRYTPKNSVGYISSVSWNSPTDPAVVVYPDDNRDPSLREFTTQEVARIHAEIQGDDQANQNTQTDFSAFTAEAESPARGSDSLPGFVADLKSQSGFNKLSTHTAYVTDRSPPDGSAAWMHSTYYQRWAIEESINQISNHFMPRIDSGDEKLRLYGVNLAILFQNWHTLINRALSPELGLRLSVTHQQLLRATEDVAFTDHD